MVVDEHGFGGDSGTACPHLVKQVVGVLDADVLAASDCAKVRLPVSDTISEGMPTAAFSGRFAASHSLYGGTCPLFAAQCRCRKAVWRLVPNSGCPPIRPLHWR